MCLLDSNKLDYFTYRLPEDRTVIDVMRGIILMPDFEDITADLSQNGLKSPRSDDEN